ncbi:MAG: efflux RND transporter periplasmic adaptor subunit [Smithellaceae bacterium]
MISRKAVHSSIKNTPEQHRVYLPFLIFAAFIFVLICTGCGKEKKAEVERLVNVKTSPAEKKRVQPYLETTGTLKAEEEVTVSSEVDGIVRKITVEEGSRIQQGMLLAAVNDIDYGLEYKKSEAALKQSQASLANARAEFSRKHSLYEEELITRQQFDDVSTKLALAQAEMERARAALGASREKLARTKIYSPLTGAVKEKKISIGDYVRNGTPLFALIKIDSLKLNFTISEKDAAALKIGQEVVFTVDAFAGQKFKGRVSLLYPNVEERTRTLQAEAVIPNADHLLKPGYFARTQIFTQEAREAVVIPVTALLYDGPTIRVFVVNDKKAHERIIKIGNKYGEDVEVLEGLQEKEQVVVIGQNNLSEGVKVNVAR